MNAMYRPGVTAPCRTFQSRPRTGGDRPLVDPGLYPSEAGDPPLQNLHFEASFGTPKRPRGRFGVPRFALQEQFSRFSGVDSHLLGTAPDKHQDRHKERPRRGPNPAFRSELWDPKAASRPVWGPQVRLTRTIQPIFRCGFTPPRDRARQAPRSAQRAAATGTQPCISKRALGPQSGLKAGLGSPGSLDENNSGDFRVWIHTSSKLRSSTRIDIRKPHATDTA